MPSSEVDEINYQLAEIYGVDVDDVEITVDYVTSGTLDVILPRDISESELIEALEGSISDVLGVHVKDVIVVIEDTTRVENQIQWEKTAITATSQ